MKNTFHIVHISSTGNFLKLFRRFWLHKADFQNFQQFNTPYGYC